MLSEKARMPSRKRGPSAGGPFFYAKNLTMQNLNFEQFLKIKNQFQLGTLTTESFNVKSESLSRATTTSDAISILKEIDTDALDILKNKLKDSQEIKESIEKTLKSNRKVYICGCGATGRLALSLEFLYRQKFHSDDVIAFMAGGDYALIKSVEKFEDETSFGKRQLNDLGFSDGDMLLAITEGGETSFVIGAANEASANKMSDVFFLYCNPDEELARIKRSNEVLLNKKIRKVNLTVGAMAISGSTRMQATTVQMFISAHALVNYNKTQKDFADLYNSSLEELIDLDYSFLSDFIERESNIYFDGGIVSYKSHEKLSICVLTDTTERSPTFSLRAFEKKDDEECSLSFLTVKEATNTQEAWKKLLLREPRCLSWSDINEKLNRDELYKFDISKKSLDRRNNMNKLHKVFTIDYKEDGVELELCDKKFKIAKSSSLLVDHLKLKLLLNTHSTIIMTKLGRVEGNVMSYVRPSNYKLIDRAVRYIIKLSSNKIDYDEALKRVIKNIDKINANESIVLKCLED